MTIYIITKNKDLVEVSANLRTMSSVIRDMLDDDPDHTGGDFSLDRDAHIIRHCVEFCDLYTGSPFDVSDLCNQRIENDHWVHKWLNGITPNDLCELIGFSHFIGIDSLYTILTYHVAYIIKNNSRTSEDIRKIFNIVDDFTEEERSNFTNSHRWVYDINN